MKKFPWTGHAIVPDQDFDIQYSRWIRPIAGFVHAGFDEWRKYYNDVGGYDPAVIPVGVQLRTTICMWTMADAWIDFGLTSRAGRTSSWVTNTSFKRATESTLDWGYANGKNIYPATQSLDEQTHSIKLDVTQDFDDWHVEDNARGDFYTETTAERNRNSSGRHLAGHVCQHAGQIQLRRA